MRLSIDDNTLAPFEPRITSQRNIEQLVEQALKRISHVEPNARVVVLTDKHLTALESRLGNTRVFGKPEDVVAGVSELADVRLGNLSFQFTPAQYRELNDRASRQNVSVEQLIQMIVQAMIPQFFTTAPADPPVLVGSRK
jgi:hypothetical protein